MVWPAVIAAGAAIGGGAMGMISGNKDRKATEKEARLNREMQYDFAQQGIKWRVEDAQNAGVHPLYSLGASLPTYSPSPITYRSGNPMGEGISRAGQNISRAVEATATNKERQTGRIAALAVERGEIENELLKVELAKKTKAQTGPAFPSAIPGPIPGQGDVDELGLGTTVEPVKIPAVQSSRRNQEAGAFPETRWARTATGFQPVPSPTAYEDADIGNPAALSWYWRNQVLPNARLGGSPPPKNYLPKGAKKWQWSSFSQEWQPYYGPRRSVRDRTRDYVRSKKYAIPSKKSPSWRTWLREKLRPTNRVFSR